MINEIKTIVKNYLANEQLCGLQSGEVVVDGIRISDKIVVPMQLIHGNLKEFTKVGDKVTLIRNGGGQEFFIVEIVDLVIAHKSRTLQIEPIIITDGMTISSISIKEVIK